MVVYLTEFSDHNNLVRPFFQPHFRDEDTEVLTG